MLTDKFRKALKLSKTPAYRLAWEAGLHPNTLSKLVHGYLRPKDGDKRLIKIGALLGLKPSEIFDKDMAA